MAKKKSTKKPSAEKRIIDGLQSLVDALRNGEEVEKRFSCRKIELDMKATSYNANKVKSTRGKLGLSQALFAKFLGVSEATVRAWEGGRKEPSDIACRFMDEIRYNPEYWRDRFVSQAKVKK